jgi:hypothetical protein
MQNQEKNGTNTNTNTNSLSELFEKLKPMTSNFMNQLQNQINQIDELNSPCTTESDTVTDENDSNTNSEENQEDKIRQQEFEEYRNSISNNPYTKEIFNNKYISVGEGDSKFNFPVDPNILTDILYDSNKWAESMFEIKKGQNGKDVLVPNIEHQLLVATVAKYGKQFLNKYAEHQKALGSKNAIESIENVKKSDIPSPANSDTPVKSIAEAMAKYGKVSN